MPIYKEKPGEHKFSLSENKPVTIQFDGFKGTEGSLIYFHNGPKTVNIGELKTIDSSENLKGKTLAFGGAMNNSNGEALHLRFTFTQGPGNILIYNFPEDYTGTPEYTDDKEPNYEFEVQFV